VERGRSQQKIRTFRRRLRFFGRTSFFAIVYRSEEAKSRLEAMLATTDNAKADI
jgi:hypothetical protein